MKASKALGSLLAVLLGAAATHALPHRPPSRRFSAQDPRRSLLTGDDRVDYSTGFEPGQTPAWGHLLVDYDCPCAAATFNYASPAAKRSGAAGAAVTVTRAARAGLSWHVQLQSPLLRLLASRVYTVCFWARVAAPVTSAIGVSFIEDQTWNWIGGDGRQRGTCSARASVCCMRARHAAGAWHTGPGYLHLLHPPAALQCMPCRRARETLRMRGGSFYAGAHKRSPRHRGCRLLATARRTPKTITTATPVRASPARPPASPSRPQASSPPRPGSACAWWA